MKTEDSGSPARRTPPTDPPLWVRTRYFIGFLALGMVLPRIYFLVAFREALVDSDEAVLGLMGRHLLRGEFSPFFWGQYYMGSLEAVPAAVATLLGVPPDLALKVAASFLFLLFLGFHYKLAQDIAGLQTARLATLLVAVSPPFLLVWSLKLRGYLILLVVGTALLWLALRVVRHPEPGIRWAGLGVLLGLGWWASPLILCYALPVSIFLLLQNEIAVLQKLPQLLAGYLAGSLPFWVPNLLQGFPSFQTAGTQATPIHIDLINMLLVGLPVLLGIRQEPDHPLFIPYIGWAFFCLIIWLAGKTAVRSASRMEQTPYLTLAGLHLLAAPLAVSALGMAWFMQEPRYLIPLYSTFYILLAIPLSRQKRILQGLALGTILLVHLVGASQVTVRQFTAYTNVEPMDPLIEFLEGHQIRSVIAPYWVAYRLTHESSEQIIATPLPNDTLRYERYWEQVMNDSGRAVVHIRGPIYDQINPRPEPPKGYAMTRIGAFEVFHPPAETGRPE